jgi:hypothetical protein
LGLFAALLTSAIFGGWEFARDQFWSWLLFTLVWLVAVNFGYLVFNWLRAPAQMDRAREDEIAALRDKWLDKEYRKECARIVSEAIDRLRPFLKAQASDELAAEQLRVDVNSAFNDISKRFHGVLKEGEIHLFNAPPRPTSLSRGGNPKADRVLQYVDDRLETLRELLRKYSA